MATINQLVRKPRKRMVDKSDVPALQNCRNVVAYAPAYTPPRRKSRTRHCVRYAVYV